MGVEGPGGLSGSSKADALRGGELPREDVFLFWHPQKPGQPDCLKGQTWRGLVTPDGWKYAVSPEEETGLLFNLNEDPWEQRNRFIDPGLASLRQSLHERLTAWMRREEDPALKSHPFR
jgi:arylsulfatase A-like enzyme